MQLDLDKEDTFEATHPETGAQFVLRPIYPREFEQLQRAAGKTKDRDADGIKFSGLFAAAAIREWSRIKQDCTGENRVKFGEKYAYNIMPWLINQCMDAARGMETEEAEAKNA